MLLAIPLHLLADVRRARKTRPLMNQASCCLDHLEGDIERIQLNHPLHLERDLIGDIDIDRDLMNLKAKQRVFRLQGTSPKSGTERESAK
jgi:hypothetical protein